MAVTVSGGMSQLSSLWDRWNWAIKLGLSIGLLWFVMEKSGASLSQVRVDAPGYIALAALVCLIQPLINIPRWSIVLRMLGYSIPTPKLVSYFYIGLFFNQILPASVGGDVVRVFYLGRHDVPWRHSISSVLLDRLVALGGLVVLYLLFYNLASSEVVGHADAETLYYLFLVGIAIGLAAILVIYGMATLWTDHIRELGWWGAAHIAELLRMLLRSVEVLGSNLWASIGVLGGLGVAVHLVEAVSLLLVLHAFGYSISFVNVTAIAALVIIVQSLPISLGGWGARELVAVVLLQRVGVGSNDAFFISVILGLLFLLGGVPGIVFWLMTGAERPKEPVNEEAQSSNAEVGESLPKAVSGSGTTPGVVV